MKKEDIKIINYESTIAKELFKKKEYPWEVLPLIKKYILELMSNLGDDYVEIKKNVFVDKDVKISPTALIEGPCIIGKNTEIRHSAYIRENVIIGDNCVIGNSSEIKNSIIFNNTNCPHYNYVGDSIIGENVNLAAGVILSNLKNDNSNVKVKYEDEIIDTGLRKFGAIVGDNVKIGCNSVLCPGTIIYPNTSVYPLTKVRGTIKRNKIVKDMNNIVDKGGY